MNNEEMTRQMFKLHKSSFDNSFSAFVALQDHMEGLLKIFIDQSPVINDEGKKMINQWVSAYKKERDNFKKAVNKGYDKTESIIECSEMKIFRDQSNQVYGPFLNPMGWMPYDFKKFMDVMADTYKNVYDEFKQYVEKKK